MLSASARLLAAVALLAAAALIGGCEYRAASSGQALQQEKERATAPDQISRDVAFSIYENDRPRAVVEAARMERYEREDSTYTLLHSRPSGSDAPDSAATGGESANGRVTARIFEGGAPADEERTEGRKAQVASAGSDSVSAVIRADRIVYHDAERRFEARGRVVVTTASGKRLESEHLAWLEEERRITTPGFVKIITPTDRIQGYGLRADENLDSYQLGRVTGQVTVENTP